MKTITIKFDLNLEACPFCGKFEFEMARTEDGDYRIWCEDCGSCGPLAVDPNEAAVSWNKREVK